MAAIAWSSAAVRKMGLPPEVVFHEAGYRGGSRSMIENFGSGHYPGVPFLVVRHRLELRVADRPVVGVATGEGEERVER